MTFSKTIAATSLVLLLSACQASVDPQQDAMMDDASSSAVMEDDSMMEQKSSLTFVGGSSVVDHDGGFAGFTLDLGNSADLVNSTVTASIAMESVYTDSDGLTGHLKREDFFDTENYPVASFTSTEVISKGDNKYDIVGDLTLKGVTKSVVITATLDEGVFTGEFELPRKEFGVGNDSYGDKILDEFVPVKAVVYIQ